MQNRALVLRCRFPRASLVEKDDLTYENTTHQISKEREEMEDMTVYLVLLRIKERSVLGVCPSAGSTMQEHDYTAMSTNR